MNFTIPPVKRFTPADPVPIRFPLVFTVGTEGRPAKLAADYLRHRMRSDFGARALPCHDASPNLLVRVRRGLLKTVPGLPGSRALKSQAYRLVWSPGTGCRLDAETAAGALHGAMTVRQILAAQAEGLPVPAGIVDDWPDLKWRGLQDDIARGRIFSMDHAQRQIQRVAELKGNLFQFYMETRFAFPSRPAAGLPGSMTPDDARRIEAFASALGVTLLPQVNCWSHMELLLSKPEFAGLRENENDPRVICPLHPGTRPLLRDLLNDIMDAFDTPIIPVGLDEVWRMGECPRCRRRDPGETFLSHVLFLHETVTARNRRMMIWHDMLLDRLEFAASTAYGPPAWAENVLNRLPRDIMICDWQYNSTNDTTRHFAAKGFETLACNYMKGPVHGRPFPFDFSAAHHTSRLYSQARRAGASGALQTVWGGTPFENAWLFFAHSLSTAWTPAQPVRVRPLAKHWALLEMGIDGLEYEDVIARLSVPLFGGTGKRSVTVEDTGPRFPLFHVAASWYRALGRRMIDCERRYTEDLARRIRALRKQAKRGQAYLAMLDIPIWIRRLHLDEADKIVRAARLAEKALTRPENDPQRQASLCRAVRLMKQHAQTRKAANARIADLVRMQGVDTAGRSSLNRAEHAILQRCAWLEAGQPFEKVFWKDTETPYER